MILSLLKVGLLSLASFLSTSKVAVSSYSSIEDHTATIQEKAQPKRLIDNHISYIGITQNDLNNGYMDNFTYSHVIYSVNFTIGLGTTDEWLEYICYAFEFDNGVLECTCSQNIHTLYISLDIPNRVIKKDVYTVGSYTYTTYYTNFVLYNTNVSGTNSSEYLNFFSSLRSYIPQALTITLTQNQLNTISYSNLADLFVSDNSLYSNIYVEYGSNVYISSLTSGKVHFSFDSDRFYIDFYIQSNYGLWAWCGLINEFPNNNLVLYIRCYDSNSYESILNAVNSDLRLNIFSTGGNGFSWVQNLNFNAPFGVSEYSPLVAISDFNNSQDVSLSYNYDINVGNFRSGGETFNKIRFIYDNAYSQYFYDEYENTSTQWNKAGYGFFHYMAYFKENGQYVIVYQRTWYEGADDNKGYTIIPQWINDDYKDVYFINGISVDNLNKLTAINRSYNYTNYNSGSNWLHESFGLINVALTGMVGLLNYKILPGITIGALILVPFAVSMLLFVIYLFKR